MFLTGFLILKNRALNSSKTATGTSSFLDSKVERFMDSFYPPLYPSKTLHETLIHKGFFRFNRTIFKAQVIRWLPH
ncbi:hypothetical protein AS29_020780 [Bacillus sp. SJS]|nr:hypothetical protein AS29_020780 [Bacillus sp. SJS]